LKNLSHFLYFLIFFKKASDKCGSESECLSFHQYIDAAYEIWLHQVQINSNSLALSSYDEHRINIIVTTESKQVQKDVNEYNANLHSSNNSFVPNFHIITNPFDVTQDTGYFDVASSSSSSSSLLASSNMMQENYTVDDIMLSTLSSLQLQLHASRLTIGNCCSNFHLVLKDLLNIGCGGVQYSHDNIPKHAGQHTFQCLQNHPNPKYRICCSWDKSIDCQKRRHQQQPQ
jgi:hypothetical protein